MRNFSLPLIVLALLLPACKSESEKATATKPVAQGADTAAKTTTADSTTKDTAKTTTGEGDAATDSTTDKEKEAEKEKTTEKEKVVTSSRVFKDGGALLSLLELGKVTSFKVKVAAAEQATPAAENSAYVDFSTNVSGFIVKGVDKKRATPVTDAEKKIILGTIALLKVKKITDCGSDDIKKFPGALVEIKLGAEIINIAAAGSLTCKANQFYLDGEAINSILTKFLQGQIKTGQ